MKAQPKKLFSGASKQITATISVALVLLILGIIGALSIAAASVTRSIKENMGFTIVLNDNVDQAQINSLKQQFTHAPYISNYSFLSADEILAQEEKLVGFDIIEAVGVNPYQHEFTVNVKAQYASSDSIAAIVAPLRNNPIVDQVTVHDDMVDNINANIRTITLILGSIAIALLIVSFVLINNTVRLTIYSRRFLLHTMQLVGATAGFIRRPIIGRNVVNGIIAATIASFLLIGLRWIAGTDPDTAREISVTLPIPMIVIVIAAMYVVGIIICALAALFATNKYLKQSYDELF
ncbi:MAG: permease-like cell division protein FtsX [Muribaculaceae bacterium]|nr:permease-like cell division protein FtsX [Muribaculaceae bacterium]